MDAQPRYRTNRRFGLQPALLALLIAVIGCTSEPPTTTAPSATMAPTAAGAPSTPAETPTPPSWVPTVETVPNPIAADGTPWLLAAGDKDSDALIVRRSEGSGCHAPVRTTLAWYEFAGGTPAMFYRTPEHSQVLQVAANRDYVVWSEVRVVYNGTPPAQLPCPQIDLPWLRLLVLERATGTVMEVDRDDGAAPAGRFVLDGTHLVFSKNQGKPRYDDQRLESLELRDLVTGAQRTLHQAPKGGYVSPLALSWPRLLWADRENAGAGIEARTQLTWGIADLASFTPRPLRSDSYSEMPAAIFAGSDLFLSVSQALKRFPALDADSVPVPSGILGRGIRSVVATHRVLASTAQSAGRLEVYGIDAGWIHPIEGEVQTLVATTDAIVWQQATGSGSARTFSLSKIAVPH